MKAPKLVTLQRFLIRIIALIIILVTKSHDHLSSVSSAVSSGFVRAGDRQQAALERLRTLGSHLVWYYRSLHNGGSFTGFFKGSIVGRGSFKGFFLGIYSRISPWLSSTRRAHYTTSKGFRAVLGA